VYLQQILAVTTLSISIAASKKKGAFIDGKKHERIIAYPLVSKSLQFDVMLLFSSREYREE
jgi:hypothetical protein